MKQKVYYIIYGRLSKKYPSWFNERVRMAALYLVDKKFNNQKGSVVE